MFDIAFSELLVIAVVALIVIGPEKLPKVARTLGLLAGRLQRYVATVKSDIDRELQFQELQKLQDELRQSSQRIQSEASQLQSELRELQSQAGNALSEPKPAESEPQLPVTEPPPDTSSPPLPDAANKPSALP